MGNPKRDTKLQGLTAFLAGNASPEVDRLIYDRVRLGIMSVLSAHEVLSFSELKRMLETTDGNLATHARKLEDAGYIACKKRFEGRMPRTDYRMTSKGRKAFARYLDHMEALIKAARGD